MVNFRTLLEPMEALLQLMLKWDPVQRGGRVNSDTKKPLCFEVLEQILNMKVRSCSSASPQGFSSAVQKHSRCTTKLQTMVAVVMVVND